MPFVIAFAVALALTPALAFAGARLGFVDRPAALKIHGGEIPVTGGIAVVAALLAGTAAGAIPGGAWTVGAILLVTVVGAIDDLHPRSPVLRLGAETAAGLLLVAGGLRLGPLGPLGGVTLVLATVALCNAVNMLDGQDGLAAGLIAIAALGLASLAPEHGLPFALAGAMLGFLAWNRPPARVFLGDSGAYAAGVALAVCAADAGGGSLTGLAATGLCLAVFVVELLSTVIRRLRGRTVAVEGDRGHAYDRLAARLGSRTRSTLAMWAAGAIAALGGYLLLDAAPVVAVAIAVGCTIAATIAIAAVGPTTPYEPEEVLR